MQLLRDTEVATEEPSTAIATLARCSGQRDHNLAQGVPLDLRLLVVVRRALVVRTASLRTASFCRELPTMHPETFGIQPFSISSPTAVSGGFHLSLSIWVSFCYVRSRSTVFTSDWTRCLSDPSTPYYCARGEPSDRRLDGLEACRRTLGFQGGKWYGSVFVA